MSADILKQEFIPKYLAVGEQKFYRFLLVYALNKLVLFEQKSYKGIYPNLEFIDYYEKFILMYRREGDMVYFDIARIFRRAAHKIYRIMLKKNMTIVDLKFLNLV